MYCEKAKTSLNRISVEDSSLNEEFIEVRTDNEYLENRSGMVRSYTKLRMTEGKTEIRFIIGNFSFRVKVEDRYVLVREMDSISFTREQVINRKTPISV